MRTSERWAVVAVIVMTLPALLALPLIAAWKVVSAWGGLGWFARALFCASLAAACSTTFLVFRRRLGLFWYGRAEAFSFFEELLLLIPIAAAVWAVTQRADVWTGLLVCVGFLFYLKIMDGLERHRIDDCPQGKRPVAKSADQEEDGLTLTSVLRHLKQRYRSRRTARVSLRGRDRRDRGRVIGDRSRRLR